MERKKYFLLFRFFRIHCRRIPLLSLFPLFSLLPRLIPADFPADFQLIQFFGKEGAGLLLTEQNPRMPGKIRAADFRFFPEEGIASENCRKNFPRDDSRQAQIQQCQERITAGNPALKLSESGIAAAVKRGFPVKEVRTSFLPFFIFIFTFIFISVFFLSSVSGY